MGKLSRTLACGGIGVGFGLAMAGAIQYSSPETVSPAELGQEIDQCADTLRKANNLTEIPNECETFNRLFLYNHVTDTYTHPAPDELSQYITYVEPDGNVLQMHVAGIVLFGLTGALLGYSAAYAEEQRQKSRSQ